MKVLLTGTTKGLGFAIRAELAKRGHSVVTVNRRPPEVGINHFTCDLSDLDACAKTVRAVAQEHPDLNAVFFSAGILGPLRPASQLPVEEMERVLRVNFLSTKVFCDYFIERSMVEQYLHVSSGAATATYPHWSAYSISKVALLRQFDFYRSENPMYSFYSVSPGPLATDMNLEIRAVPQVGLAWESKFRDSSVLGSATLAAAKLVRYWEKGLFARDESLIDLRALSS